MRTEQSEQIEVVKMLRAARPALVWTATANGGKRDRRAGEALKSAGVRPGVSDLLIFTPPPCGGYFGAAIEMKRSDGVPSDWNDDQREWASALIGLGWYAGVAYGAAQAIGLLRRLGYRL